MTETIHRFIEERGTPVTSITSVTWVKLGAEVSWKCGDGHCKGQRLLGWRWLFRCLSERGGMSRNRTLGEFPDKLMRFAPLNPKRDSSPRPSILRKRKAGNRRQVSREACGLLRRFKPALPPTRPLRLASRLRGRIRAMPPPSQPKERRADILSIAVNFT